MTRPRVSSMSKKVLNEVGAEEERQDEVGGEKMNGIGVWGWD